ncbi:unnamed protein product, partial [Tetraodon nigroviridis]
SLPPNRGLERALEEASSSGVLNLSSRKLKEFPQTAASHDLSDTVEADLSKNRLTDFATDMCHFVALETLNLYHNCIKTIPDSIVSLQSLTSLNISRNQICSLPPCLCSLPLKVLNASNNRLDSLPETIGRLQGLMELDVSCNDISALPAQIGRLGALRELNVRRNNLCVLPEDLAELPLVKFDFSCNKVSTIPVCYRRMKHLQSLQLENNPLQSPPAQICIKGKVHIFKYLSVEACRVERLVDPLYLPVMECLSQPSVEDLEQQRKQDSDSGVGSDSRDNRLSATEALTVNKVSCCSILFGFIIIVIVIVCQPSDEDSPSTPVTHITEDRNRSTDLLKNVIFFIKILVVREWESRGLQARALVDYCFDMKGVYVWQKPGSMCDKPSFFVAPDAFSEPRNKISKTRVPNDRFLDSSRRELRSPDGGESYRSPEAPGHLQRFFSELWVGRLHQGRSQCPVFGLRQRSAFLGSHRSTESADPQFTMRRKLEQLREELELVEQLRHSIESRLKLILPEDLGAFLMDGVVLCHLANHIHPRSVAGIHAPSPAVVGLTLLALTMKASLILQLCHTASVRLSFQPKLGMAKCRRNVENFLEACRKIGVPEDKLCLPHHILEGKGLTKVGFTVQALVDKASSRRDQRRSPC